MCRCDSFHSRLTARVSSRSTRCLTINKASTIKHLWLYTPMTPFRSIPATHSSSSAARTRRRWPCPGRSKRLIETARGNVLALYRQTVSPPDCGNLDSLCPELLVVGQGPLISIRLYQTRNPWNKRLIRYYLIIPILDFPAWDFIPRRRIRSWRFKWRPRSQVHI